MVQVVPVARDQQAQAGVADVGLELVDLIYICIEIEFSKLTCKIVNVYVTKRFLTLRFEGVGFELVDLYV